MRNRSGLAVLVLTIVAVLFGCQCGAGNKGPGGGNQNPGGPNDNVFGGGDIAGDPAEKNAVETVKKHGGSVKQEAGRVVEVHLFHNTVNDDTLKDLAPLTKTRILKVTAAKITAQGLKHLAGMGELTELDLALSQVDAAGLKEIAALKQLRVLHLQGMKATGPDLRVLAPLNQLEDLAVNNTQKIGDAGGIAIAQLKRLKKVTIDNSDLGDAGLAAIADLPELHYLSIHGNFKLTSKGFNSLSKAKSLEELIVGFTFGDDSAKTVASCTSLRVLRLFHTEISDKGFREFKGMHQLQELEIRRPGGGGRLTNAAVDEFKKANPNCKVKGP